MIPEPLTLRSWGWNTTAAVVLSVFAAAPAAAALSATAVTKVVCATVTGVLLIGAARVLFAGVTVTESGLTVRELLRTRQFTWSQLRQARVLHRAPRRYRATPWATVVDYTDRGTRCSMEITALGSYREESARRWVDQLNQVIARQRRLHPLSDA